VTAATFPSDQGLNAHYSACQYELAPRPPRPLPGTSSGASPPPRGSTVPSASVILRMRPTGLPLLARVISIVTTSPGCRVVLVKPTKVSADELPSSAAQCVTFPLASLASN